MRLRYLFIIVILFFTFFVVSISSFSAKSLDNRLSQDVLLYYFDLVLSGNYESAAGLWEPSSLARANRLGIEYDNIPLKGDCGSPIIYDYNRMKKFLGKGVQSVAIIDSQVIRWKFKAELDEEIISQFYYTAKVGEYFWLITPQDYYARDWSIEESKYFRFYISPKKEHFYNDIAAQSLDDFVEKVAGKISISADRLELLSEMKIDYYLCNSTRDVALLSGRNQQGVFDPASDAVITNFMPHFHQVSLLLINYKLRKLPLFTIPFIREGFASTLGGRWQRSPEVVFDFGAYILKYGILDIDSVFDSAVYNNRDNGDICDPVGACLTEYLWTKLGEKKFFELYRTLSGDYRFVKGISNDDIKAIIAKVMEQDYDVFKADFMSFVTDRKIHRGLINPGSIKTDEEIINENGLMVSVSNKWIKIEYQADKDIEPNVSLLFNKDSAMDNKTSMLFLEQNKNKVEYNGYRYGIKLDKNEIGLYDFAANLIKAKYVDDFDSDTDYYDNSNNKITAYFDISLLDGVLPGRDDYTILK